MLRKYNMFKMKHLFDEELRAKDFWDAFESF